jgi:subtilisin family serine protease
VIKIKTPYLPGFIVIAVSFLLYLGASGYASGAAPGGDAPRVAKEKTQHEAGADGIVSPGVMKKIQDEGRARVIVKLRTPRSIRNEKGMSQAVKRQQRADIAAAQGRVRGHLQGVGHLVRREFKTIPYVALEVDAAGLAILEAAGFDVEKIYEDRLAKPLLAESIPQVEGDLALQAGIDGTGSVIAIVDTGVDKVHPFLAGKVIEEACYAASDSGIGGSCPNGQGEQEGTGAGVPCTFAADTCQHGTHVAGIAAGSGSSFSGVAPGADLISIQVFHSSEECGYFEASPCPRASTSDIIAALERVYEIRDQHSISAVNMSLGGGYSLGACDANFPALAAVIDNLRTAGIATVVASGNDGFINAISWPACISSAISVGAVDESNQVASFSNVSQDLDLFGPGTIIESSVPGGGFDIFNGTSMATPHVAGAWALMEQAYPAATVDENLTQLQTTGRPVTDARSNANITRSLIRLGGAIGIESPLPVLSSIAPLSVGAWGPDVTITVTGSNFVPSSVVFVDGQATPTIYISDSELSVVVTAAKRATTAASIDISVFSPPPGGGTSSSIALELLQPSLSVDSTSVGPGNRVTVTLTGGPGNFSDWLAVAAVGSADTAYIHAVSAGHGLSTVTWTATMPDTPGDYEFRLLTGFGTTLLARSPTVTVAPRPPAALAVSATAVNGGDSVTVTLSDGPGNNLDWLALAAVGDPDNSYLQYVYIGAGATSTTWTVDMPATPGTYEFRLFEDDSYTRLATSPTVTVTPSSPEEPQTASLSVSATAVNGGDAVTVTLSGGPGNNLDWLALAAVGDPDTSYVQYIYVGAGATSATWTVNMPSTPGDYEFRLLENNGYTRLATSPAVTVSAPPPPVLEVSATAVNGGDTVTVTLNDGPGNNLDWLALAAVGDPNTTYLQYTYVGAGATSTTWTVDMPATPGAAYEFRLFANNGYTLLATSPSVVINP